jgi:hypothetical protein
VQPRRLRQRRIDVGLVQGRDRIRIESARPSRLLHVNRDTRMPADLADFHVTVVDMPQSQCCTPIHIGSRKPSRISSQPSGFDPRARYNVSLAGGTRARGCRVAASLSLPLSGCLFFSLLLRGQPLAHARGRPSGFWLP